jgi:hypothetical protein
LLQDEFSIKYITWIEQKEEVGRFTANGKLSENSEGIKSAAVSKRWEKIN